MDFFNTFHIYNENAPVWNIDEPDFKAQSPDTQLYYVLELLKMRRGVQWGSVKIHPWMYFHTNYWHMPIDIKNEDGVTVDIDFKVASLRDNEMFINDHAIRAEIERKGIHIMGSRRLAKSCVEASYTAWTATIKGGGEGRPCMIYGDSVADISNVTGYISTGMSRLHPMFNLYPPLNLNYFSESGARYGYKNKDNTYHVHANIKVRNMGGGSQTLAGTSPISAIFDECGKYDIIHHFNVAKIALSTPFGWRTIPWIVGTGGDATLCEPSQRMFTNPETFNLITMDWSCLDNQTKKRTWVSGQNCGLFIPGQCSIEFPKVKTNLASFLKVKHDYLEKIEIEVTDWDKSTEKIEKTLEELRRSDSKTYVDYKSHIPLDVKDCFLSTAASPLPTADILLQKIEVENSGITNFNFDCKFDYNLNKLILTPSKKVQAEYPFQGGNIDCATQIFIAPPDNPDFNNNIFVGGLDCYKSAQAKTDSLGAFYIVRRRTSMKDPKAYHIAASLVTRPDLPEMFYDQVRELQLGYGARTLQESADLGYENYLRLKHKGLLYTLLADGRNISVKTKNTITHKTVKFGLYPSTGNKGLVREAYTSYFHEDVEFILPDGSSEIKKGVYRIKDLGLLQEALMYSEGGNFDRLTAFGHALLWAQYLDSIKPIAYEEKKVEQKKPEVSMDRQSIYDRVKNREHLARQRRTAINLSRRH